MVSTFSHIRRFWQAEEGSPAIEAAFLFPVMVSLLCGVIDTGIGLIINMKVTNASQVVADLVSRQSTVSAAEINDAIVAGQLSLMPYDTSSYGVDIAGIQFLTASLTPTVQWRETVNMKPNPNVTSRSAGLGAQNEGVVAVTVTYKYTPYFSSFLIGDMTMGEEAYVRGRKGLFVTRTS